MNMENIGLIENVSNFFAHPFVISIATVLVGSFFLTQYFKRKEMRQRKRNDAIKTTEEVCALLNESLSCLFWQIRDEQSTINTNINSALINAFAFRLKFRVKVNIYLKDEKIWKDYDIIIREIYKLCREIYYQKLFNGDKILISQHINELKGQWEILDNYTCEPLKSPFDLYFEWNQVVWYKTKKFAADLFAKSIKVD